MTQLAIAPLDTIDDILSWKRYSFAKNQSPISISKRFLREYFTLHHSKTPHHNTLPTEHVEVHSNCSLSSQFSMAYTNDCVSGDILDFSRIILCHDMMNGYLEDRYIGGTAVSNGYRFHHWHLLDYFIYFSHHMLSIPPPGWVSLAHNNHVPCLGTFITEWEAGAKSCSRVFANAVAAAELASQLARIAAHHSLDGWFVNIENEIEPSCIQVFEDFLGQLRRALEAEGVAAPLVLMYDSVTREGKLEWQNQLNERNSRFFAASSGLFTNYTWVEENLDASARAARDLKRSPRDVFVGVDVFARGCPGKFASALSVQKICERSLSVALFAPAWTYEKLNHREHFLSVNETFWRILQLTLPIRPSALGLPFTTNFNDTVCSAKFRQGKLLERSEWYSLADQELQATFGAEQFFPCPSQVLSETDGSSAASGIVCAECCPPTSVSTASTIATLCTPSSTTSSTPGAGRSRRRVHHPDLCAGRRALLEQMRCVSEGAASTPLRHALGRLAKRLGLERLFQRAEDALAERDCRALHAALFESPATPLCSQDVASSSSSSSTSSSSNACEDCLPRQYLTLCKRTAFTGNASLLLGGTFLSPDDICKFQLFYVYIPMRAVERYRRRICYAFSAHCATIGVEFCVELLVRRFDAAHDAHPEDLEGSRLSAHIARIAPMQQRDNDSQNNVVGGDAIPQKEPLVASFLIGTTIGSRILAEHSWPSDRVVSCVAEEHYGPSSSRPEESSSTAARECAYLAPDELLARDSCALDLDAASSQCYQTDWVTREYDGRRAFGCGDENAEGTVLLYVNAYCFPGAARVAPACAASASGSPERKRPRLAEETHSSTSTSTSTTSSSTSTTSISSGSAHCAVSSVPPHQQWPGTALRTRRERQEGAYVHSLADLMRAHSDSCGPRFPAHFQVLLGQLSVL